MNNLHQNLLKKLRTNVYVAVNMDTQRYVTTSCPEGIRIWVSTMSDVIKKWISGHVNKDNYKVVKIKYNPWKHHISDI